MTFFGGDHSKSHYTTTIPFDHQAKDRVAERKKRDDTSKKLKALGYRERYFHFTNGDDKQKERAKALAEAEAQLWFDTTGIRLEVTEGFFL